jgi:CHAD domain-containing protein
MDDASVRRACQRWSKEGKKLRRALEPLRDADVYLARLNGLNEKSGRARDSEPKLSLGCAGEIDTVEKHFRQQRQERADELAEVLAARMKRLTRITRELEVALAAGGRAKTCSPVQEALTIFAGLASEFPSLDCSNLHAYRKRLKGALYLVKFSSTSDARAERLAAAFGKIHDTIGEWHDWHSLAGAAERLLSKRTGNDGLVYVLRSLAEEALQKALALCRGSGALVMESCGPDGSSPRRKPVVSDCPGEAAEEEHSIGIFR